MRLKKPAVVIAGATALMTLAACGGGGGQAESPGGPSGTPTFQPGGNAGAFKDPNAKAPLPVPSDAQKGGTLTVLTREAPSTLDPTRAYYTDATAILSDLVTRSLTQYRYNPQTKDMQLIPDMATDLGRPNKDNTAWTFTLRPGLKYEDGTPVKAEDVAYAIKRSFAIKELPDGPTYQTTFFLDGDKYKGPFEDGTNYKGVVVKGNDITIKMRRPFADMDYYASFPAFTAIPQSKDNPQTYENHPMATGPYMYEDYKPGQSLTLKKNPYWDPKTDPGRIQAVDGWEFQFAQDTSKLENIILNDSGTAQTTLTYDNVTPPTYKQIEETDPGRLVTGTSPCTYMWFLDMRKIKDIRVRKAIGYAFPYDAAWKAGGEVVGVTRVPGTAILPPGTAGRVDYDPLGIGGEKTDPQKAKSLLKQAGALGFKVKFLFRTDDDLSVEAKNEEVKALKAAGFDPVPIASSERTYREDMTDYKAPINVRSSGWCSDWPDGGSWFPAQWSGTLVGLEGMPNPANFKEPAMDKMQDHILNDMSPSEAVKAWGQFDKTMEMKYYPAVNLGYAGTAMLRGSKVGGMFNDNVRGMPTFAQMYITK